jgi:hypothetical protein
VLSYYTRHRTISEISGLLTVIAVFLGILFYGLLRDHLRGDDTVRGLAATAFGGALLFGASGLVGAGALWALADSPSHLSPALAQSLYLVNEDCSFAFASAGIALMLFAYGMELDGDLPLTVHERRWGGICNLARLRMGGPVTCVYHAYEGGELVATGRLTLEGQPQIGDEVRLNGRTLVVAEIVFSGGSPLLTLEPRF